MDASLAYALFIVIGVLQIYFLVKWLRDAREFLSAVRGLKAQVEWTRAGSNAPESRARELVQSTQRLTVQDFDSKLVRSVVSEMLKTRDGQQVQQLKVNLMGNVANGRLDTANIESGLGYSEALIEAYPYIGIAGTLLAINAARPSGSGADLQLESQAIMDAFGGALGTTLLGLLLAVLLGVFLRPYLQGETRRLVQLAAAVREWCKSIEFELDVALQERFSR